MSIFTRLKTTCVLGRCFKLYIIPKYRFHSLLKPPRRESPTGARSFFNMFKKNSQRELREADNVPDYCDMIYRNKMSGYILGAQIISVVTGSMVLLGFIMKGNNNFDKQRGTLEWSPTSRATQNEEVFYLAVFIVILVLVQVTITRTPIRIYKVPKTTKYITVNYGNYFFGKEKYNFHRGQISCAERRGILPWRDFRYNIETKTDRRTVILLDHYFRRPADLSIMLGEQKDPELEEIEK